MFADLVGMVLFAVLLPLGMWAVFRFSQRVPEVDGDTATLRLGPAVAVLGWLCLGLGAVMLGAFLLDETRGEPLFVVVMIGGVGFAFLAGGVWLLASHRREYVRFSHDGVEGQAGWKRLPVSLGWAEIVHVRFSSLSAYLTLFGPTGRRVRVSALLFGSDDLVALVEQHVRADGVEKAVAAFRQYRAAYGGSAKR